jgi:hypothetical protein
VVSGARGVLQRTRKAKGQGLVADLTLWPTPQGNRALLRTGGTGRGSGPPARARGRAGAHRPENLFHL